jgi:hydrogenase maturation protease
MQTLLLGMGNPILSDDAVGVRLVTDLRARFEQAGLPTGLHIREECSVGGLNLVEVVEGFDRLIVVDSIRTDAGEPGDYYAFTAESLRETCNLNNVHDANFATALELGRRLGHRIPAARDTHIFAVEVRDNITFSERLTPDLEAAYPALCESIYEEVRALLGGG